MKRICCFAGHRDIYNIEALKEKLNELIIKLITEDSVEEFMVGNYGIFDRFVQKNLFLLKETYPHIKITLVIPYLTKSIKNEENKGYECILVADMPENTPRKYQILKCNEYMVKKSDFLVCFVKNTWGGASKTLEYAKKKKLKIYNLSDLVCL